MRWIARGRVFRPRLWAFALALAACAAGVALGQWQSRRAEERRTLAAIHDAARNAPAIEVPAAPAAARDFIGRRVAARGEFIVAHTVFLEFRQRRGRNGYEVLSPLRLGAGPMHVLVNRGWIAAGATREALPEVAAPRGESRIEGVALERLPQLFEAGGQQPQGRILQNLRLDDYRAASGLALQPFILEQWSGPEDGLSRDWPRADSGAQKNEMYAMQWYLLAGLAIVLFVVLSFRHAAPPA